jgi:hypothetical protein
MRSPADIIYHFLTQSLSDPGQLFVAFFPDVPDEAVSIYDTAGKLDGRMMRTGEQIEHYGVQIQVRGKVYSETFDRARSIALLLDQVKKESIAVESSEVYVLHNVSRSGAIIPVGIETVNDRRRHLFTINMTITISQEN